MNQSIAVFIDICLLRKDPRDLPASPTLQALALLAYVVSGLLLVRQFASPGGALLQTLVELLLFAGFLYLLLAWRGRQARFQQSFTALLGCGVLFNLASLPSVHVFANHERMEAWVAPAFLLWLLLICWSILVFGHVLRHAMEIHLGWGIMLAVLYTIVALQVLHHLFPGAS